MFGEQTFAQLRTGFTSTETTRTVRDGESWTATSTFTQLLSSGCGCGMDLRIVCRSMGAGHSSWHKALRSCRMSDAKDASISPQTLGRPLPPLGRLPLSLFSVLFVHVSSYPILLRGMLPWQCFKRSFLFPRLEIRPSLVDLVQNSWHLMASTEYDNKTAASLKHNFNDSAVSKVSLIPSEKFKTSTCIKVYE